MHLKRFLPFAVASAAFVAMEVFLVRPESIFISLPAISALTAISIWLMAKGSLIDRRWWNFSILPILFSAGLSVYSVLMPFRDNALLMHSLFVLDALFLYYYLRSVYYHLVLPTAERSTNLENISSFGNFLSFFFIAASVYGLESFIGAPAWQLIMLILFVSLFLSYQMMWASRISIERSLAHILIGCLVVAELAWTFFYLPFNFNVTGAILAIEYYVLTAVLRANLRKGLDKRMLELYLGFGLASIVILLITARWM